MTIERVELGLKDSGAGCSCCAAPEAPAQKTAAPAGATTQILVEGMTCGHCVSSVTEELSALDEIEQVSVDLNAGGVSTVTVHSSAPLRLDAVRVAVDEAGYTVILASDDPRSVLTVMELSRASYRKMKQNLWWAAGYNLISVPLAAGILAPVGFVLPMSVGAILMSLSTIVVALNAQLLRRLDLRPDVTPSAVLQGS